MTSNNDDDDDDGNDIRFLWFYDRRPAGTTSLSAALSTDSAGQKSATTDVRTPEDVTQVAKM